MDDIPFFSPAVAQAWRAYYYLFECHLSQFGLLSKETKETRITSAYVKASLDPSNAAQFNNLISQNKPGLAVVWNAFAVAFSHYQKCCSKRCKGDLIKETSQD
jgi:hypothetical protein